MTDKFIPSTQFIEKLPNICVDLELVSVYDMDCYSVPQLLYRLAQKINDTITNMEHNDLALKAQLDDLHVKLEYLLGEGLMTELQKIFEKMYADGTLQSLVEGAIVDINKRIDNIENNKIPELQEQLDNIIQYNLKDFGATFDGTDDTLAWEKLRDSLSSKGGKLKLPIGKTVLSKKIVFDKPLWIDGIYCGLLDDVNGSVIEMRDSGEIVLNGINSNATNFTITGTDGNTGNGINFTGGIPSAKNILVIKQGGKGIVIGSETEVKGVNSFFMERIKARENKGDGIAVVSSQTDPTKFDANAGTIINSDSCGNGGSAFLFKNCANNIFINLNAEVGNKKGITFENAMGNTVIQPYLEGNIDYEISFDSNSYQNKVDKLRADISTTSHIIDNGQDNVIIGIEREKAKFNYINGIYGIKKAIISTPNVGGYFGFTQLENRDLRIAYEGYESVVNVDARGVTQPTTYKFDKVRIGNDIVSMTNILYGIAPINFDNCPSNIVTGKNMVVSGAKVGDFVQISTDKYHEGVVITGIVISDDLVNVRVANVTNNTINLGDVVCKAMVTRME